MKITILILFTSLCLNTFGQLSNTGFENWVINSGSPAPAGWGASAFGVDSTTDAYEGNKALVVWTWYNYAPGYVSSGATMAGFGDFAGSGVPYTQKPLSLSGMYKFDTTNVGNLDSVLVVVFLKKYNPSTHLRDTVALGVSRLPGADVYTPFTVNVTDRMPGIDPDSIVVIISSQRRIWDTIFATNTCRMPFMDCAYFYVDALQLNTLAGVEELSDLFSPVVYPNPTNEYVHFNYKVIPDGAYETLTLFDNTGKPCYTGKINSISNKLKVKNFGRGMYHYIITTKDNSILNKGKFVVTD